MPTRDRAPPSFTDEEFVKQVVRAYDGYGISGADKTFAELVLRYTPDKLRIEQLRQACTGAINKRRK